MLISEEAYLEHYGTLHKSGRYKWGSGDTQNMRNKTFLDIVADLKKQGLTDAEIARGFGEESGEDWSSTKLRALKSIAKAEQKQASITQARRLKDTGMSNIAVGLEMGINESSVRALLADGEKDKADILETTANMLKAQVAEKKYLDVGTGTEQFIGISKEKLGTAVAMLQEEGYELRPVNMMQLGTTHETRLKVLCAPGTTQKEAWLNRNQIQGISDYSDDGGRSFLGILPPISVNPSRVDVRYVDEGGAETDGVVYVRPGIDDISLGKARYAQVRIVVGEGHYIKGMAMYKDDLPKGVDLLFNTAKENTGNKLDALKPISDDPDNPFGTVIRRQIVKVDDDGRETVTSSMNLVNEEGDWMKWSKTIASQVLSKQSPKLAKTQLDMTFEQRKTEFDEIMALTNPTVRKKLLKEFSDSVDKSAVHLKAARIPRMGWHAILPIDSIPPTQIYAPNFLDGERVALIRYPHGGTFEIADLIVNNNHPESKRLLGDTPRDAVGIHHTVAQRLSGADFDGDTVLVIPNNVGKIKITPALEGLRNFDPRITYKGYDGMKVMSNTQAEMGAISNLITDMTIQKASATDVARAVRHSMVVIDAEKHELNYKQSAADNGIRQLKEKYQIQPDGKKGASTLISRAGAKAYVPERDPRKASQGGPIDPVTGKLVYTPTNAINTSTGRPRQTRSKKLAETDDAYTLSSGTPMEALFADHSNRLKGMANQARLEMIKTPRLKQSDSAKKVYKQDVASLNTKLALAIRNRPLERQAQRLGNATY